MGAFLANLFGAQAYKKQQEQQQLALDADFLWKIAKDSADPSERSRATKMYTDLLSKHGGKEGKQAAQDVNEFLMGHAAMSLSPLQQLAGGQATPQAASPQMVQGQPIGPGQLAAAAGQPTLPGAPQAIGPAQLAGAQQSAPTPTPAASMPTPQVAPAQPQRRGPLGTLLHGLGTGLKGAGIGLAEGLSGMPVGGPRPMNPEVRRLAEEAGIERRVQYGETQLGLTPEQATDWAMNQRFASTRGAQNAAMLAEQAANDAYAQGLISFDEWQERRRQIGLGYTRPPTQRAAEGPTGEARNVQWANEVKANPKKYPKKSDQDAADYILREAQQKLQSQQTLEKTREQKLNQAGVTPLQQTMFGAYAQNVLKLPPGTALTDDQKLQALAWGKIRSTTDPELQAAIQSYRAQGTPTKANPQGDPYIDMFANRYIETGMMPTAGMSMTGAPTRDVVMNRADEMLRTAGFAQTDLPMIWSGIKSNEQAFSKVVGQGAMLTQFESTLAANTEQLRYLSEKYARTGSPLANRVANYYKTGKGDDDVVNFVAQMHVVANEWAKVMSTMGGASSANVPITSAADAERIMSPYLANGQVQSFIDNVLTPDKDNRSRANEDEKKALQNAIRATAALNPIAQPPGTSTAPLPPTAPPARTPVEPPGTIRINPNPIPQGGIQQRKPLSGDDLLKLYPPPQ